LLTDEQIDILCLHLCPFKNANLEGKLEIIKELVNGLEQTWGHEDVAFIRKPVENVSVPSGTLNQFYMALEHSTISL
jgi:hypothetical protein